MAGTSAWQPERAAAHLARRSALLTGVPSSTYEAVAFCWESTRLSSKPAVNDHSRSESPAVS